MWNRVEMRALEGFIFAVTPFNFTSIAGNLPAAFVFRLTASAVSYVITGGSVVALLPNDDDAELSYGGLTTKDGKVAAETGLPGKPAPDTFLAAAAELEVEPARAVVIEDAISGVAAGKAGGFALVIGIDHHGDTTALRENGADIVVESLLELLCQPQS